MGGNISHFFDKTIYVIDKDEHIRRLTQQPAYAGNVLIDRPDCLLVKAKDVSKMKPNPRLIPPMQKLKAGEVYFLICDEWRASPPTLDRIEELIAKVEQERKVKCF